MAIGYIHTGIISYVCLSSIWNIDAKRTTIHPRTIMKGSGNTKTKNSSQGAGSSSVLNELKETIKQQAAEIELLKKAAKQAGPSSSISKEPSHGHGPPASSEVDAYSSTPFYRIAFSRVGWLSVFLASLSLTAFVMNSFEHTLSKHIELAFFVPLLIGHGGNTGGQTVGTVLTALSTGSITISDAPGVIAKESMSGLLVGSFLGLVVGPVSHYTLGISAHVSTVIFFALPMISIVASSLASVIPFVCVRAGINPAIVSAPAMTSFVDVGGLIGYFVIAQRVFMLFDVKF